MGGLPEPVLFSGFDRGVSGYAVRPARLRGLCFLTVWAAALWIFGF